MGTCCFHGKGEKRETGAKNCKVKQGEKIYAGNASSTNRSISTIFIHNSFHSPIVGIFWMAKGFRMNLCCWCAAITIAGTFVKIRWIVCSSNRSSRVSPSEVLPFFSLRILNFLNQATGPMAYLIGLLSG